MLNQSLVARVMGETNGPNVIHIEARDRLQLTVLRAVRGWRDSEVGTAGLCAHVPNHKERNDQAAAGDSSISHSPLQTGGGDQNVKSLRARFEVYRGLSYAGLGMYGFSRSRMTDAEVGEAYRRYGSLVLRRCQRILRDRAAAEDALQDVFVRLWRYGNSFREADSKVLWLYRVADRCCFDRLARRGARAEISLADQSAPLADKSSYDKSVEDREVVMCFLDRFDDRVKQVAVLHYLDEMTQEEIAAATGWSRQTVFKKLAFLRDRAQALRMRLCGGAS